MTRVELKAYRAFQVLYLEGQGSYSQAIAVLITQILKSSPVVYSYTYGLVIATLDLQEYIPYTIYSIRYPR